ncbi:MAG: CDP-diacylglycerol--glycerol-3-phosphate 3-phosphatidyltransferase [Pseudomonadota bacterium]
MIGGIWNIPNILTMGRILAAPLLILLFLVFEERTAAPIALALFTIAALTDFIDGWVARRFDMSSPIGQMLDPIADKAMVLIALMLLLALHAGQGLPWLLALPVTAIVLREVLVSGLREYLGDVKLPVTRLAKWKTTAQLVATGLLLAALPGAIGPALHPAGLAVLWIAAGLTLISGWDYFRKGLGHVAARKE